MKYLIIIIIILIPFLGISKTLENLEYIPLFNNDVAAIKKGNEWRFIDQDGKIIVDFRKHLVSNQTEKASYPIFSNERDLIAHQKDGALNYVYIDKTGKAVIKPQFLNAVNFEYGKALLLKVEKETIGSNDIFNKDVVSYHYFEVVIDKVGKTLDHLTQLAIHVSPKYKNPPAISSRFISRNLVALKGSDNKCSVKKID
ncbi:WG repeat-containing protein [Bizionia saleffrena]|uniref:WG repeat-containing protein n=1 Tax=Bizionia saleffrena TaxID=291189 RepID=A0A8H2LFI8_9FLAO|nr:WG repeat-containing protein [Bizionia saleffrena]TYB71860.1 WG repeat-containing protein [Bizionia saleffrena]